MRTKVFCLPQHFSQSISHAGNIKRLLCCKKEDCDEEKKKKRSLRNQILREKHKTNENTDIKKAMVRIDWGAHIANESACLNK
jgi:hypothetical protein